MKLPLGAGEQLHNEMLALGMVKDAPSEWLAFYRQVREYLALKARAEAGKLPRDNAAAAKAYRKLRYVLDALDAAEKDLAAPPVVFNFAASAVRRCRTCGCTDDDCRQCIARTGRPCSWVEVDLCSACVPAEGGGV